MYNGRIICLTFINLCDVFQLHNKSHRLQYFLQEKTYFAPIWPMHSLVFALGIQKNNALTNFLAGAQSSDWLLIRLNGEYMGSL